MGEFSILMSHEMQKKWDRAIKDHFENPYYDQPKEALKMGHGIYRVIRAFDCLVPGDNILLSWSVHTRIVKLATPSEKQAFLPYTKELNAYMYFTPEQMQNQIRPVTKDELYALLPHLSPRIKLRVGYQDYMMFYPELICSECCEKNGLEVKAGSENQHKNKRCGICDKRPILTYYRNALKPKGR